MAMAPKAASQGRIFNTLNRKYPPSKKSNNTSDGGGKTARIAGPI